MKPLIGVVGGLGPLASAEFLKTVYEQSLGEREQTAPRVVLWSDPSFPDRTETLLAGGGDVLLRQLVEALEGLRSLGAGRIVICCMTMHHLLPRLPGELLRSVWSLVDVVHADLLRRRARHLLVCTSGARRLELFEGHPDWKLSADYFVMPDEGDQAQIHDLIYRVKRNEAPRRLVPDLRRLLAKYEVDSFIAGCTEIHLLAKEFDAAHGERYGCLDPLTIIAREVAKEDL
jgi:aspartate racemase